MCEGETPKNTTSMVCSCGHGGVLKTNLRYFHKIPVFVFLGSQFSDSSFIYFTESFLISSVPGDN